MTTMAIAWVLRRPELSAAIVGASRPDQVDTNAAASGTRLSDDVLDAIDQVLAPVIRA
jgi:aryl-alcohol dehydrogenase-like predicted oxidoreductase